MGRVIWESNFLSLSPDGPGPASCSQEYVSEERRSLHADYTSTVTVWEIIWSRGCVDNTNRGEHIKVYSIASGRD